MTKRRGRPKLDPDDAAPSVTVSWRLSARNYDRAWRQAADARLSLPDFVRRILQEKLDTRAK